MPTKEEISHEIHQAALRYQQDKLRIAREELESASAEGREVNPMLTFGIVPHNLGVENHEVLNQFFKTTIRPEISLLREAISDAVAEIVIKYSINERD